MSNIYIRPYTRLQTTIRISDNIKRVLFANFGSTPIVLNKSSIPELKNLSSQYFAENDAFQMIINAINNLERIELWIT